MDLQTAYQMYLKEHQDSRYKDKEPLSIGRYEVYFRYLQDLREGGAYRKLSIHDLFEFSSAKSH